MYFGYLLNLLVTTLGDKSQKQVVKYVLIGRHVVVIGTHKATINSIILSLQNQFELKQPVAA
jgi:hypothetical protein